MLGVRYKYTPLILCVEMVYFYYDSYTKYIYITCLCKIQRNFCSVFISLRGG